VIFNIDNFFARILKKTGGVYRNGKLRIPLFAVGRCSRDGKKHI